MEIVQDKSSPKIGFFKWKVHMSWSPILHSISSTWIFKPFLKMQNDLGLFSLLDHIYMKYWSDLKSKPIFGILGPNRALQLTVESEFDARFALSPLLLAQNCTQSFHFSGFQIVPVSRSFDLESSKLVCRVLLDYILHGNR